MSGPVTPFKSPNDGKQITRGARSHDSERDSIAGKALFTSPVMKGQMPPRILEPVDETDPTLNFAEPHDAVGRSPTVDLFATPPLHVRWKRPRQQVGSSAHAAGLLPSMQGTEQESLDAASSPQADNMWLSGKTERDLFSTPDDQMISANQRKIVDFGDLVVESLQAQEQLASQSMDILSDTESDEDLVRMEVPGTACTNQGPRRWSADAEEKLARLVALYADSPQEEKAEEESLASMENELHELLNQHTVARAPLVQNR